MMESEDKMIITLALVFTTVIGGLIYITSQKPSCAELGGTQKFSHFIMSGKVNVPIYRCEVKQR